ncbi:MAG TPA: hypothetical protein VFK57_12780 [Vicinamibacterales bacterium]|nr:hypothetical protein [Vicinamibacterales bacterium]
MTARRAPAALAALLLLSAGGAAARPRQAPVQRPPDFRVQIWGDVSSDFSQRVDAYVELRRELERGLPPLQVTADAREIVERVRTLGKRLRAARRAAREGDIFTRGVSAAFKDALRTRTDVPTCVALLDDNPGPIRIGINDTYPTHAPLATMPANVLAALPRLPDGIEYRLVGPHLILFDTHARLLIDRIPLAVHC